MRHPGRAGTTQHRQGFSQRLPGAAAVTTLCQHRYPQRLKGAMLAQSAVGADVSQGAAAHFQGGGQLPPVVFRQHQPVRRRPGFSHRVQALAARQFVAAIGQVVAMAAATPVFVTLHCTCKPGQHIGPARLL